MSKQYNKMLQEKLEQYLKDENLSQAKAAPILGISQAALSQYRRSMYDKGDIEALERKLEEFFQIKKEKAENEAKAAFPDKSICRIYSDSDFRRCLQADSVLPAGERNCGY